MPPCRRPGEQLDLVEEGNLALKVLDDPGGQEAADTSAITRENEVLLL